ncbi:hypothetical protein ACFOHS_00830 [Jhaorihella thermophila]
MKNLSDFTAKVDLGQIVRADSVRWSRCSVMEGPKSSVPAPARAEGSGAGFFDLFARFLKKSAPFFCARLHDVDTVRLLPAASRRVKS